MKLHRNKCDSGRVHLKTKSAFKEQRKQKKGHNFQIQGDKQTIIMFIQNAMQIMHFLNVWANKRFILIKSNKQILQII
jgi:hypothetical protein